MNKEKFFELSNLYLMNELDEKEKIEFENTIMENDELRNEFNEIKKLFDSVAENKPADLDEELLTSARYSLMRAVRAEAAETSVKEKTGGWLKNLFGKNFKYAFGGAGMLVVGVFIGYIIFSISYVQRPMFDTPHSIDNFQNSDDVRISNIKIPTSPDGGGQIEVSFDAIKPISYKGTVNDPMIQKLLASALVTEKNPGLRLKTVSTIAEHLETQKQDADPKIKNALITALKVDGNPAVRKEALNALLKFNFDSQIRDAFLFVLSNDSNSGMRVAAINALAQLKVEGKSLDEKIMNVLNNKAENDKSEFIRLRAASLVREVN